MPPDASSRPATGLNFIEISTSPYGPPGATMTLNSFFVARCINTFRPLGAPSISSTTHWPSTVVQLAIPCVSKSNFSSGTLSGTLISVTPARAGAPRVTPYVPSAASAALNRPRRDIVRLCIAATYLRPARLRLLLLQDRVETVEDRHAALEQVVIVRRGLGERADGEIHARRLVPCELAVVQVRLVDDLRDDLDPPVLEPEPLDQGLERAVLAVMPEIRAEHIEWDALPGGISRVSERELRVWIAEALDEPGRRDAVDVRAGPRHPGAATRGQRRAMAPAGRSRSRLHGPQTLGRGLPEGAGALARRRFEVINGLYPVELALEAIELGADRRDRAAVAAPVAIDLREDLSTAVHNRLVFHAADFVEQCGDLVIGHRLDAVDPK